MGLPRRTGIPIWSSMRSITPSRSAATSDFSIQSTVASSMTSVSVDRASGLVIWATVATDRAAMKPAASAAAFFGKNMTILRGDGFGGQTRGHETTPSGPLLRSTGTMPRRARESEVSRPRRWRSRLQERPAEQDGLVEHVDHVAEQDIGQAGLAAIDPSADLGTGTEGLVSRQEVLADLIAEPDGHL